MNPISQKGITTKELDNIVEQIDGKNTSTFTEDELTPEGTRHVKSLHIAVECRGMIISRVLIDNVPALNICPAMTLERIKIEKFMIRLNGMMVRAFEGTKTAACREIDLKVLV